MDSDLRFFCSFYYVLLLCFSVIAILLSTAKIDGDEGEDSRRMSQKRMVNREEDGSVEDEAKAMEEEERGFEPSCS